MQRALFYLILSCLMVLGVPAAVSAAQDVLKLSEPSGSRKGAPTAEKRVDLNTATPEEIGHLPGVTRELTERIIRNRPYRKMDELVTKKVMGKKQFAQLREYIVVGTVHK